MGFYPEALKGCLWDLIVFQSRCPLSGEVGLFAMRSSMFVEYLEVQSPLVVIRRDSDFLGGRDFQVLIFFRLHADPLRKQGVEKDRAYSVLYQMDHFIDDIFIGKPLGVWFHPQENPQGL